MTHHLKPQEYRALLVQDEQVRGFVTPPVARPYYGTRPFAEPERPKIQQPRHNVKEGEPA